MPRAEHRERIWTVDMEKEGGSEKQCETALERDRLSGPGDPLEEVCGAMLCKEQMVPDREGKTGQSLASELSPTRPSTLTSTWTFPSSSLPHRYPS